MYGEITELPCLAHVAFRCNLVVYYVSFPSLSQLHGNGI